MKKRFVCLFLTVLFLLTSVFIPTSVTVATSVAQRSTPVSGGLLHSIALADGGAIWIWGSNKQLQLGMDDDVKYQSTPCQLENTSLSMIVSVSAGYSFSLALKYDGRVYVFGADYSVYELPLTTEVVAIAAGQVDGLALDVDGSVWQWTVGYLPRKLPNLSGVAAISAGGNHFFALTYSGDVWAWGENGFGQLGDGTTTAADRPIKIKSLANIVSIAAGSSHSLAISHDGSVYAWGSNSYGQLGDGSTQARYSPVKVNNIKNAIQVSAGNDTSMALTKDNEIFTWGYGEFGQLGNDTTDYSQNTPARIKVEGIPTYIASGFYHSFYITNKGHLYVCGRNKDNQLGTGNVSNVTKPIKVLEDMDHDHAYISHHYIGASGWAEPELSQLYAMDLLPPMLWGNYQNNVTRAEFACLLINLYQELKKTDIVYPDITNFKDINKSLFEIEIRKAYEIGLVAGISESLYNPEGIISRQEAAKMICTFISIMEGFPLPSGSRSLPYYKDAPKIAKWAEPFVAFAYDNKIIYGSSDGNFNPLDNLTREQILAVVSRTIQKYGWD